MKVTIDIPGAEIRASVERDWADDVVMPSKSRTARVSRDLQAEMASGWQAKRGWILALAFPLTLMALQQTSERGPWYYDFKSLPASTGVIEVAFLGGSGRRVLEVSVLSDGRVRILESTPGGDFPSTLLEAPPLAPSAVDELVERAVECGLPVFDAAAKLRDLDEYRPSLSGIEDGATLRFKFRFESFAETAEPAVIGYEHEFTLDSPDKLARDFPTERELQCANDLALYLSQLIYAARRLP